MTKKEARELIQYCINYGFVIHPNTARKLYEIAELPIPEHLKPLNLTDEEKKLLMEHWNKLFEGEGEKHD